MLARKCSSSIIRSRSLISGTASATSSSGPMRRSSMKVSLSLRFSTVSVSDDDGFQVSNSARRIQAINTPVTATEAKNNSNANNHEPSSSYSSSSSSVREFSSMANSSSSKAPSKSLSTAAAASMDNQGSSLDEPNNNENPLSLSLLQNTNNDGTEISLSELRELASQPCTPLSLSDMFKYASANANSKNYQAQRLRNARFLHKELPIRVAQRAVDLLTLPHGLNKTSQVQEIAHAYLRYLQKLKDFPPPTNEEEELQFTDELRTIVQDRTSIPMAIAKGVASLKDHRKEELDLQRLQEMEKALYRFFNARTGLRLLTEHHILSCTKRREENEEIRMKQSCIDSLPLDPIVNHYGCAPKGRETEEDSKTAFLGCIREDCDPYIEARAVADQIKQYCKDCYGVAPEIEVLDCTPERYADSKFTYVPNHLQHTLAELLKNSCRATVQRYLQGKVTTEDHVGSHNNEEGVATDNSLPSIRVVIAKGAEDITIKVADKGGGVPRSVIGKMWTFAHSGTSDEVGNLNHNHDSGNDIRGFGLPLARIYARYFGGELTLKSMEGYGVDAYLYLPVLGDACENLPERVQKSPANHDSVHDGNHHAYQGDTFSSSYLSGEEPWGGGIRHFSNVSFKKIGRVAL